MPPPDEGLFRAINNWPTAFGPTMVFFSDAMNQLWVKIAMALLIIGMLWRNEKTRRTAVQALIAFPIANGFTDLFKNFMPMNRPYQELAGVNNWLGLSPSHGTASAHSANMAAVAFVFAYHLKWWGAPWIAVALIVGLSRVYVGAHYPYQVLLGWSCGVVAASIVTRGWTYIQTKRSNVVSSEPKDEIEEQA